MAAPPIPPMRLGPIGTGLAVEELHRPASRELADRYVVTAFTSPEQNLFYRDDLRYARALLDGGAIGRLHLITWRDAGRLVPREGRFTGTPWRQWPYRGACATSPTSGCSAATSRAHDRRTVGPRAQPRLHRRCHRQLHLTPPRIPVPPEPNDERLYGTEGVLVLAGSSSERRVTHSSSDATIHATVFRGIDNGYRAELVDFADAVRFGPRPVDSVAQSVANAMVVPRALDSAERTAELAFAPLFGAGPVPLWRPRGSTGLVGGLPGQRISSSATFVA